MSRNTIFACNNLKFLHSENTFFGDLSKVVNQIRQIELENNQRATKKHAQWLQNSVRCIYLIISKMCKWRQSQLKVWYCQVKQNHSSRMHAKTCEKFSYVIKQSARGNLKINCKESNKKKVRVWLCTKTVGCQKDAIIFGVSKK